MVLWFLRCLFVLLLVAVSFMAIASDTESFGPRGYMLVTAAAVFGVVLVGVDLFLTRKSLAALSGAFFGLVVGMVFAYGLTFVVDMMVQVFGNVSKSEPGY